ncbi:Protein phosphatase 2C-like [Rhynchospora pubera]|uniref:protein-serine/threonine phosphatase n=1 Tax=Rhynchospora pubera TaxID=906938 RepID=A0AAV8CFP0_9POAL|nr:Protein phosphatase 2C-like [Rhynchospora pubera]
MSAATAINPDSVSGPIGRPPLVPLATLIGRELREESSDTPIVKYEYYNYAKRGEDLVLIKPDCLRVPNDPSTSFSVFGVFDGHNGVSAAVYSKEHLLDHVMSAVPEGISREEWLQTLPRALVAGFVKCDIDFQRRGEVSGTTATLVVIDGLTVTVASVGDSRCILVTPGGELSLLTVDHRLDDNEDEVNRVRASGGEVGRLNICGGQEVGPLRCWPGGLCLSRSIGDMDVGEFIVPVPHVKQVKLPSTGGRLIIASDGIWDAMKSDVAVKSCRGLFTKEAARTIVKNALRTSGLKDDTTCLVVDVITTVRNVTAGAELSLPSPKKAQKLKALFFGKRSHSMGDEGKAGRASRSVGSVEELFEEGSAMLEERLPSRASSDPFRCAICQVQQSPTEDLLMDSDTEKSQNQLDGPFLCTDCRKKKDAMEGKNRPPKPPKNR